MILRPSYNSSPHQFLIRASSSSFLIFNSAHLKTARQAFFVKKYGQRVSGTTSPDTLLPPPLGYNPPHLEWHKAQKKFKKQRSLPAITGGQFCKIFRIKQQNKETTIDGTNLNIFNISSNEER